MKDEIMYPSSIHRADDEALNRVIAKRAERIGMSVDEYKEIIFEKDESENINIRKLIIKTAPPFEWDIDGHPIREIGSYYHGVGDGFSFDKKKVAQMDECTLWRLYGLINAYWLEKYKKWNEKYDNFIYNMRNNIIISRDDVGDDMLSVYEKHYKFRN